MKYPFKKENILTPITGGLVLLAVAELWINGKNANYRSRDIEQIFFMNQYIGRNPAMVAYGAASMAMSFGVGVAEEYIFLV